MRSNDFGFYIYDTLRRLYYNGRGWSPSIKKAKLLHSTKIVNRIISRWSDPTDIVVYQASVTYTTYTPIPADEFCCED